MLTPPQILLFGHPGSGKTNLLGALLRASETQPAALGGTVADLTGHLDAIRAAVYGDGNLKATHTEITAVPVQYRGPEPADFRLFDCDGRAATWFTRSEPHPLHAVGPPAGLSPPRPRSGNM